MKGYELKVSALAAALKCAGNKDVRFYLNGVLLDFPRGRIVATDGHRLFCGAIPAVDFPAVIVPRALVEAALKANKTLSKRTREGCALFVNVRTVAMPKTEQEPARELVTVELNHVLAGFTMEAPAIDGRFPEYERVIPGKVTGAPSAYNCQYIAEAAEALALYAENYTSTAGCFMQWGMNGPTADAPKNEGPGVFTLAGVTALVIIMPVRTEAPEAPADMEWYSKPQAPKPAPMPDAPEPEASAIVAHAGPDMAAFIDPSGALQAAGLLKVDADPLA